MATVGTSSLDVNSLVNQLVSQERASYAKTLTTRETKATVQLSALSSLKGALSTFKTAVDTLKTGAAFSPRTTTSGNTDVFAASSSSDAATGSYNVRVMALARAHQLASAAFSEGSTAQVGTGTLTITYGSTSFDVVIEPGKDTLAGIRDAINKASGNTGVQATLLNESGGTRLILTSARTGAQNGIGVTQSGGDGGLAQLVYDPQGTSTLTEVQAAQDAHIRIASFDHYSATNTVTGAIDGVTLNLKSASPDEDVTLSISEDTASLKQRVSNFVAAYNSLYTSITRLRGYDAATGTAGPLLGDALVRSIESQIGLELSNPVAGLGGSYTTLASIGITRQADGKLAVDDTKLSAALEADRTSVAKVFGSENGVAVRLSTRLEGLLGSGAALESRNVALQKTLKTIEEDTRALDARMAVVEGRYRKQFTALDALLQQLQTTSSYLSSQLAALNNINNR